MVKKERLTLTPHRLPSGLLLKDFTQRRVLTTIVKFKNKTKLKKKKKKDFTQNSFMCSWKKQINK